MTFIELGLVLYWTSPAASPLKDPCEQWPFSAEAGTGRLSEDNEIGLVYAPTTSHFQKWGRRA